MLHFSCTHCIVFSSSRIFYRKNAKTKYKMLSFPGGLSYSKRSFNLPELSKLRQSNLFSCFQKLVNFWTFIQLGVPRIEWDFKKTIYIALTVIFCCCGPTNTWSLLNLCTQYQQSQSHRLDPKRNIIHSRKRHHFCYLKAVYALILTITSKVRLCHLTLKKKRCKPGARGWVIVNTTHHLVVERS